jgi:hypothetical protein
MVNKPYKESMKTIKKTALGMSAKVIRTTGIEKGLIGSSRASRIPPSGKNKKP